MTMCEEVGRWVTDEVLTPVEKFFEDARLACTESRKWVEREIRTPIVTWRTQQEQRCREQECNWFCLCCNKWFCWIVTMLVRFVEWLIEVIGEWLVETVCKLIVEIIRLVVVVLISIVKWIVEFVVCFIERFCLTLLLIAGLAFLAALLGLIAAGALMPLPLALPAMIGGGAVAVAALLVARLLCELSMCRLVGVLVWALKWAIVLGALLSIVLRSVGSGFVVVLCGGIVSALIWSLTDKGCRVPHLLGPP